LPPPHDDAAIEIASPMKPCRTSQGYALSRIAGQACYPHAVVGRPRAILKIIATWVSVCLWMMGLPVVAAEPAAPRAAIIPLSIEGELSDADRATLTEQLVNGLQRGNFEIVTPDAVQAEKADAVECDKPKCFEQIADATDATHVVRAKVIVRDRDYDVQIELFDGKTGTSLAKTSEGCEICGIADAADLVGSGAATLRTKLDALAKGPSMLTLTSAPEGAEVRVDGEIVGVTPLERPVVPGKRVLRVSKEGFIAVEREVTFVEGVSEQLSFELDKVPSRLPSRPWGWVSLSLGVASVGTAIAFAVLGGKDPPVAYEVGGSCRGMNVDADGDCRRVWNTEWHVLGFGLAGAALTTLGIAILLNTRAKPKGERRAKKNKKASAQVGVGPGSFTVRGRF
jgi:hypothetical protein